MDTRFTSTIYDVTNLEDAWAYKVATLDARAFPEATNVVRAGAVERQVSQNREKLGSIVYLCKVVTPYARKVSISHERAG